MSRAEFNQAKIALCRAIGLEQGIPTECAVSFAQRAQEHVKHTASFAAPTDYDRVNQDIEAYNNFIEGPFTAYLQAKQPSDQAALQANNRTDLIFAQPRLDAFNKLRENPRAYHIEKLQAAGNVSRADSGRSAHSDGSTATVVSAQLSSGADSPSHLDTSITSTASALQDGPVQISTAQGRIYVPVDAQTYIKVLLEQCINFLSGYVDFTISYQQFDNGPPTKPIVLLRDQLREYSKSSNLSAKKILGLFNDTRHELINARNPFIRDPYQLTFHEMTQGLLSEIARDVRAVRELGQRFIADCASVLGPLQECDAIGDAAEVAPATTDAAVPVPVPVVAVPAATEVALAADAAVPAATEVAPAATADVRKKSYTDLRASINEIIGGLHRSRTEANRKLANLVAQAAVELRKPLDKMDLSADVSQRDEYKLLQSLRGHVALLADPNTPIAQVSKDEFERQIASSNVSSRAKTLLKAVCVAVAAVLGFIAGAVIGAAAGGALGSVTGPGAVATATIGAVVVGAKAAVASAAVGAGVAGALTAYGLFRDPKAIRLCKQVVKEVEATNHNVAASL